MVPIDTDTFPAHLLTCSYDLRSGSAVHWRNTNVLGDRVTFEPGRSVLLLSPVVSSDAVAYTCRLDFRINPTLTYRVNLTVIGEFLDLKNILFHMPCNFYNVQFGFYFYIIYALLFNTEINQLKTASILYFNRNSIV